MNKPLPSVLRSSTATKDESKRTGSAMPLVLIAVVLLSVMGLGLLRLGLQGRVLAARNTQQIAARCAADAGLTKAIFEMNKKLEATSESWDNASMPKATDEELPNCDATFSYKIVASSLSSDKDEYSITATGKSCQAQKVIDATVRLKSLFESAILVQDRISLMPNTLVSAYNSADPADTDFELKIGTTSTLADRIPIGPGTVVEGDVFVGVGGDPATVIGSGGTITGEKYTLTEELEFPVITPPALPETGMSLFAEGGTITLGPADSGVYTGIDLSQSGILEIAGGDVVLHITGNVDIGNGCEVIIRPDSSLILYVDGDINADNSNGFNNEAGNVKDFQLYATGTEQVFNLKAKTSIFGTVYAPDVDLTLYAGSEIHGAIVGNNVTFKSGCAFYYDEALREVDVDDVGVRFVVKYWCEE